MKPEKMSIDELLKCSRWFEPQMEAKLIQFDRLRELEQCVLDMGCLECSEETDIAQDKVLEKLGEMSEHLFDSMRELLDIWIHLTEMIDHLEDPKQRTVMTLRYLLDEDWNTVSDCMGCSDAEVHELHEKAFAKLKENRKK